MRLIIILLCLAFHPSWSSAITVDERAKLDIELSNALDLADTPLEELGPKLARGMKAASAIGKAVIDEMQEKIDENEIEENGTSSFTPGIVDEALKALKTASTGTTDVLRDLNELGPKLADLMKTSVPIGALIAKRLNPKPESNEYKALMDFKKQSAEIWNKVSAITKKPIGSLGGQKVSMEYGTEVYIPISVLKDLTNRILNPEIEKQDHLPSTYAWICENSNKRPTVVLEHLKSHLVTECGSSLTTVDVKQITEHRAILMRAFRHFRVENKTVPEPSIYLSEFMNIYKHVDKNFSIENMKVFKKDFYSYDRAIDAFFKELREQSTVSSNFEDECLLRALTISTTFNYTRIGSFARRLQNELIDLAFSSAICASSMYPDSSSINRYTQEVSGMVNLVTSFSSKWLNDSLTAAWPAIHNQIFQDQIENLVKQPGHFDREILRNAAKLTIAVLNHTGIPNYKYEMLIVRAPEKNFQFHFERFSNNYYYNKGDFGFNTVLVRRPFNYSHSFEQLNLQGKMSRLTDYAEKLRTRITYEMKDLYDAKNITEVAEGLKKKLGSFVTKNGFQGFAIARKWEKTPFKSCSAIDDVQYSKESFSTIYNFTYQNSGNMLQHCETFNFYFFL
ncbi:unnamed protein product [Caenorhabditis brenneri]